MLTFSKVEECGARLAAILSRSVKVTHCSVVEYLYYLKGSKLNLGFDNTMGGLTSRHVEVMTKEPETQGTPKHTHVLPYDPRSPSDYITRTPITVANTPDKGCEDTPRIFKVLSLDPRSPNTEVNRTPIVVESKDVRRRPFSLKPAKLEHLDCKPATTEESNESDEHDPRSPTTKVPQTPLEGKEETFLVPAVDETEAIEKTNSDEGRKVTENKSMDEEDKSYVKKLFSNDESTDKMRRPLMSVQNNAVSSTPRCLLQAKQCRTVEEEYNKNQKIILGQLPGQENVSSSTQFVENI
nr:cell division cycle-associated protein 3-like isoform X2 [Cherax quadricarinatus]